MARPGSGSIPPVPDETKGTRVAQAPARSGAAIVSPPTVADLRLTALAWRRNKRRDAEPLRCVARESQYPERTYINAGEHSSARNNSRSETTIRVHHHFRKGICELCVTLQAFLLLR